MAQPFENLPLIMERYAAGIGEAVTVLMREIARKAGEVAVQTTRVDTGLARSNWVASLDAPFTGTVPPYAPGRKLGGGEGANAAGALNQQASVIRSFSPKRNRSIHITNNVSYIGILNDGGPTVGPDMMLQRATQAGRVLVLGARILRKK